MPRSRTSRSASPHTQRQSETSSERERAFKNVKEIFQSSLDDDILRMVLIECNWRDEVAIDKLLAIAEDADVQKQYKQKNSQLRNIAEGVLGPITFEDYKTHGSLRAPVIPDSKLSASERIIGRPVKLEDRQISHSSFTSGNQDYLIPRGGTPNSLTHLSPKSEDIDLHFPKLPSKPSAPSSALSSEGSHSQQTGNNAGVLFSDVSFISQAQSAFNQQYDDAASAQKWEQYKQQISEHYVEYLEHGSVDETKIIQNETTQSANGKRDFNQSSNTEPSLNTHRQKGGRSFPVKLLSRDQDEQEENNKPRKLSRLDSADLDENILKCIYEVPVDPIDEESVFKGNPASSGVDNLHSSTPSLSNLPMTLPVIGLSVEAREFIPRSKPSKTEIEKSQKAEPQISPPVLATPTTSRSTPIEIKPGARNIKNDAPVVVPVGSPIQMSPVVSPGLGHHLHGRSPPTGAKNPVSLTGSPVFLTYKWPHGLQCVAGAPSNQPPVFTTSPRYIAGPPPPPRLPHGATFRLHNAPPTMSFPSRVVYPLAQPPFFRMAAGVPPPHPHMTPLRPPTVHMPRLPTDLDERAAVATGSPIMTTVESKRKVPPKNAQMMPKLVNSAFVGQCIQKIKDKHQTGKKVMVIVRGLPGSGKSTLSRGIQMEGVVLSTDDFFIKGGYYAYNPDKLPESHQWNRERAKEAMKMGTSPIIIDNTNTQKWEFKSYVNMAVNNGYHVEIFEPDTPWKFKPNELAKRTVHGVPKDHIQRMMNRYEHNVTVDMVVAKTKSTPANEKKGQATKLTDNDANIETSLAEGEDIENVKQTDTSEWAISEEKAAELLRHMDESSLPYGSKTSSSDRNSAPSSRASPATSFHSVTERSSTESPPRIRHEDMEDNKSASKIDGISIDAKNQDLTTKAALDQNSNGVVETSFNASVEKSLNNTYIPTIPPPSIKFDKRGNIRNTIGNSTDGHGPIQKTKSRKNGSDPVEISKLSEKLSPETLKEIDDMLDVYMKDLEFSEEVLQKREEELSALLQLLPIDEEEMRAAEMFVHLKLHDGHVDERGNSINRCDEFDFEVEEETENVQELRQNNEQGDSKMCVRTDEIVPELTNGEADDNSLSKDGQVLYEDLVGKESGNVQTNELDDDAHNLKEEEIGSQKVLEEDVIISVTVNDGSDVLNNHSVLINAPDIELQYWNKIDKEKNVKIHVKTVDTKWDNSKELTDNWEEVLEETSKEEFSEESVKPQRVRKQKYVNSNDRSMSTEESSPDVDPKHEINLDIDSCELNQKAKNQKECVDENPDLVHGNPNIGDGIINSDSCLIESKEVGCKEVEVNEDKCGMVVETNVREEKTEVKDGGKIEIPQEASLLEMIESDIDRIELSVDDSEKMVNCDNIDDLDAQSNVCSTTDSVSSCLEKVSNTISAISDNQSDIIPIQNSALDLLKVYRDEDISDDPFAQEDIKQFSNATVLQATMVGVQEKSDLGSEDIQNGHDTLTGKENESSCGNEFSNDLENKRSEVQSKHVEISQQEKPKKKTHRKIAARFKEPLISFEDKQKLFSNDWTSLSVSPTSAAVIDNTKSHPNLLSLVDSSTMTSDEDFREAENLSRGGFVNSSLKYLTGTSKKIINSSHLDTTESSTINKVHLIDKSTSTDDLKDISYSESVRFLKTCFPNVREDELECVLVNCHDNVEWAINLLLDWKYSLHLTDEEKQTFVDGMKTLKLANKPVKQPVTLTDLCFKMIEKNDIATREELEEQLIETSKERLERIEDENITKLRLRRSSSLNESVDNSRESPSTANRSPKAFKRSQSVPSPNDKCLTAVKEINVEKEDIATIGRDNLFISDEERKVEDDVKDGETDDIFMGEAGTVISKEDKVETSEIETAHGTELNKVNIDQKSVHAMEDLNKDSDVLLAGHHFKQQDELVVWSVGSGFNDRKMEKIKKRVEIQELSRKKLESNEDDELLELREDSLDGLEEGMSAAVTINLPRGIVVQLERLFGQIGVESDLSHLPVPIDHTTALRLYQCVKHGVSSQVRKQQQVMQDEEMARKLQEQEDAYASSQRGDKSRFRSGGRQRKYVPLDEALAEIQTQEKAAAAGPVQLPVASLESIMQEEEEEERKKQEFQRLLELEGGPSSISTRVKRTQLYEKFPNVDRSAIDSCFEANCFNMTETEEALRWSLGHPEERSRARKEDADLDAILMETSKQQSMQEMLDSYIYMPQVKKDYQDGAEPEYEDYRGEANVHHRLRHECFQKAQEAFRQGLKQVASFYSQQGHLHTQKIKEANMRASEQIMADRNADLVKNSMLDLHGLHIDEAIAALNRILPDLERDQNRKHITIITGKGSHSRGGVARLRPAVIAYLKRFQYRFTEEQTGVLKVTLKYRRTDN